MQQNKRTQKNKLNPASIVIIALAAVLMMAEDMSDTMPMDIVAIVVIGLILIAVVFAVVKAIRKKAVPASHTHDRIDHSKDLKINPTTGKVEASARRTVPQHSAREHWKQQLDGLLANGTIDRVEYQAMLNRKF